MAVLPNGLETIEIGATAWRDICNNNFIQLDNYLSGHGSNLNADMLDGYHIGYQPITTITANTTLTDLQHTILVDASGGNITITLPAPTTGKVYIIKKIDNTANTVTIDAGTQTIDGVNTKTLSAQYEVLRIQSDGNNWYVI